MADRYTELPDVEYSTAPGSLDHVLMCQRCQCLVYSHSEARKDHEAWHEGVEQPPPAVPGPTWEAYKDIHAALERHRVDLLKAAGLGKQASFYDGILAVERLRADLVQTRQYVKKLALAANVSWPGHWVLDADRVAVAVRQATLEIEQLRAERDTLAWLHAEAVWKLNEAWKDLDGWEQLADDQAGSTVVQANEKLRTELATLREERKDLAVLPDDAADQIERVIVTYSAGTGSRELLRALLSLITSWSSPPPTPPPTGKFLDGYH